MSKWFEFKSDKDCKHAEGSYQNCPFCRIEGLKTEVGTLKEQLWESENNPNYKHPKCAELETKHTALEDGLRELAGVYGNRSKLATDRSERDMWWRIRQDVLALLGKEKNDG